MLRLCQYLRSYILSMVMVSYVWCQVTAASQMIEAPKNPVDAFALAYTVDRMKVKGVYQIPLTQTGAVSSILIGLYPDAGKYWAGLVPICYQENKYYFGDALRLLPAESIQLLDIVDLKGIPRTIDLNRNLLAENISETIVSIQKSPALLLRVTKNSTLKQEILILTTIGPSPRMLWRETIRSIRQDGGGYDTLRMQLIQGAGEYLEITLVQTTLPGKGEKPYRPGPPRRLRFVMTDGSYQLNMK